MIDRRRLVRRHNPVLTAAHPTNVLTLGNGDFAVTVDVTGLQTFAAAHELRPDPRRVVTDGLDGLPDQRAADVSPDDFQIPLRTQSTAHWYRTRPDRPVSPADATTSYPTARGPVPYLDRMGLQRPADPIDDAFVPGAWLHFNPRRAHLGRLALLGPGDAPLADPEALSGIRSELDLWSGSVCARFELEGVPVHVTTVADPDAARVAVRVRSPLLELGWGVAWVFDPQPDDRAPFELPLRERTTWTAETPTRWRASRIVEDCAYEVVVSSSEPLRATSAGDVVAAGAQALEVVVGVGSPIGAEPVGFGEVRERAEQWWEGYWQSGGVVSFEGSSDSRAAELERRVVLSQYLLAVNSAGSAPPAETGLTYNTWSGKFHLEMHWWHAAHFPYWGRGELLERSLPWYHAVLPAARATARAQGYAGARWPKQTDPTAAESPSNIGVFLVWQQPHLIYLLELLHAEGRDDAFVREHYPLVEATAEFMADFVEERDGVFVLPAPLIPAQESYLADRATTENPTFELVYWVWALRTANRWRERAGLERHPRWDEVAERMRKPARLADGTYAAVSTPPHLIRKDHPSMLMALGWLPDIGVVDRQAMAATAATVCADWELQSTWGWDYAVLAMTAASLGDLPRAVDALLRESPKNHFLANGHNPQMPGFLSLYLPANGGVLAATAHLVGAMGAGAMLPEGWVVEAEGLLDPALMGESVAAG
ncbi:MULTISPECIES: hypothetical protein [unclassified Microbacterium]|uniref:hypothetical protein n=1 Tax=Microbacterium TaxID=33882 RepID=UPI003B9E06D7